MKQSFWQKISSKFYIDRKLFIGKKDPQKNEVQKDEKKLLRHPQAVKITCVALLVLATISLVGSGFSAFLYYRF